jgi:glycosyltransferase 2 family protein
MTWKSILRLILKISLSAGALYYVGSKLDLKEIADKVSSAHIALLVTALLIYTLSQISAAIRLHTLFRYIPISISHLENIKLYWLGLFYNLFLPGGVGGDGFKVWLIGKYHGIDLKRTIGAILSDRVSGLSVIVIMLLVFAPFIDSNLPLQKYLWAAIPLVVLAFFLFLHLFNRRLRPAFIPVLVWAIIVQMLQMASALVILKSLNVDIDGQYGDYLFLFFLSAIAGSLPITLGGIGAREVVFMWGAKYLGVDESSAVALSLLFYVASAITALPGIVFTIKPSAILDKKIQ